MRSVYLDHAATTACRPEVLEAMWPFFSEIYGNPSSVHMMGSEPREAVEHARAGVGEALGCRPGEIVFTSGGTEADNLALLGVARAARPRASGGHVVTTQIEHHAVLHAARQLEREGFRVTCLPVDAVGILDPADVGRAIEDDTVLVSVMLANNEIGTIQPIAEIGAILRGRDILFHTDAVQGAGALDLDVERLGVDLLSVSGHKIYGPKGSGALYVRRGIPLEPLLHGGEQERGRRSGTENVPGIVGLAVALMLAQSERLAEGARLVRLRDQLIEGILANVPGSALTGHPTLRLPGHASFSLDGLTGESVLVELDLAGVSCSSGSACRAGSTDPSHVLTAIGLTPEMARNGLRMTLGRETTIEDVEYVLKILPGIVESIRTGAPVPA